MICPNGVIKTKLISLPRSGHHLLVRGLSEAMGHKLVYSEFYNCQHNMGNCEYVNLQKSHDFDNEPVDPDMNYIILYRSTDQVLESWHRSIGSTESLNMFTLKKINYIDGFLNKWLYGDVTKRLFIDYDYLINNKIIAVIDCCKHMGIVPDIEKLIQWKQKESYKS